MSKKVLYIGPDALTRGNYGEDIRTGRLQDGRVYVWDSTFGMFDWGPYNSSDWKLTDIELEDVEADF